MILLYSKNQKIRSSIYSSSPTLGDVREVNRRSVPYTRGHPGGQPTQRFIVSEVLGSSNDTAFHSLGSAGEFERCSIS